MRRRSPCKQVCARARMAWRSAVGIVGRISAMTCVAALAVLVPWLVYDDGKTVWAVSHAALSSSNYSINVTVMRLDDTYAVLQSRQSLMSRAPVYGDSDMPCEPWTNTAPVGHVLDRRLGIFRARLQGSHLICGFCPQGTRLAASSNDHVGDCVTRDGRFLDYASARVVGNVDNTCLLCETCEITLQPASMANCSCTDGQTIMAGVAAIMAVARGIVCACNSSFVAASRCRDGFTPVTPFTVL